MSRPELRSAVVRCVETLDDPNIEVRTGPLAELSEQLERVVCAELADQELSLDGFVVRWAESESARDLHIVGAFWTLLPGPDGQIGDQHLAAEAWFSLSEGSMSTIRVAGRDSLFPSSLGERQFQRLLRTTWPYRIELDLR